QGRRPHQRRSLDRARPPRARQLCPPLPAPRRPPPRHHRSHRDTRAARARDVRPATATVQEAARRLHPRATPDDQALPRPSSRDPPGGPVTTYVLVTVGSILLFGLPAALAGAGSGAGTPPAGWEANAGGWPAHNYDLSNTRADFDTRVDARDV